MQKSSPEGLLFVFDKSEFVGIKKYKSFGRAFTKARGIQKGKALCRTPQSAKLFFLKKRRKGAKTVRCDCFCVGNPRRGFPVSSLMKQRTGVGLVPTIVTHPATKDLDKSLFM